MEENRRCVYYSICVDRGCPCKVADHDSIDMKVYQSIYEEYMESYKYFKEMDRQKAQEAKEQEEYEAYMAEYEDEDEYDSYPSDCPWEDDEEDDEFVYEEEGIEEDGQIHSKDIFHIIKDKVATIIKKVV